MTKIVAAGGNYADIRLTFQEYFEKLRDEATRWGKPFAALLGTIEAQKQFGSSCNWRIKIRCLDSTKILMFRQR